MIINGIGVCHILKIIKEIVHFILCPSITTLIVRDSIQVARKHRAKGLGSRICHCILIVMFSGGHKYIGENTQNTIKIVIG